MLIMSSSVLQQRLGVRLEVTGAMLNHVSDSRGGLAGRLGQPRSALPWTYGGLTCVRFQMGDLQTAGNVVALLRAS
jgi:hypothetical protein